MKMKMSMRLLWLVLPFLGCVLLASGCSILLGGGGEVGFGYSSESRIFSYHKADNEQFSKSSANLHVEPFVEAIIGDLFGGGDESDSAVEGPTTE
jgi:hypothetical protein